MTAPHDPHSKLSEADFLRCELNDAKAALEQRTVQLKESVGTALDVGLWTQRYPWVALGAAVAGGFVAAKMLIPARQHSQTYAVPYPVPAGAVPVAAPSPERPASSGGSFLTSIISNVAQVAIHGALVSAIQAGMGAFPNGETQQPANGAEPECRPDSGSGV